MEFIIRFVCLVIWLFSALNIGTAQNTRLLPTLIKDEKNGGTQSISKFEQHEVQILYTTIKRNKHGKPSFKSFSYNLDPKRYFYPAQSLGLPLAVMSLEKLNNLKNDLVNKTCHIRYDVNHRGQTPAMGDTCSFSQTITIAYLIQSLFYAQLNNSYNRLYEFLGQRYANERMMKMSYTDTRLLHRLGVSENKVSARYTNPIYFYRNDLMSSYKDIIYMKTWPVKIEYSLVLELPGQYNQLNYFNQVTDLKYKQQLTVPKIVDSMDFAIEDLNKTSLLTLQSFMKTLISQENEKMDINVTPQDILFLQKSLSITHTDSIFKNKNSLKHQISYCHPNVNDQQIKVYANSGRGYGFMVENVYIVDPRQKIEYLLTISLNCNQTEFITHEPIDYGVGEQILTSIGKMVYQHESKIK